MHTLHLVMMQLSRQKMRNNDNTAHASLLPRCIKQELTKQFAALRVPLGVPKAERFGRVLLMKKGLRMALELENEGLMEQGIL